MAIADWRMGSEGGWDLRFAVCDLRLEMRRILRIFRGAGASPVLHRNSVTARAGRPCHENPGHINPDQGHRSPIGIRLCLALPSTPCEFSSAERTVPSPDRAI